MPYGISKAAVMSWAMASSMAFTPARSQPIANQVSLKDIGEVCSGIEKFSSLGGRGNFSTAKGLDVQVTPDKEIKIDQSGRNFHNIINFTYQDYAKCLNDLTVKLLRPNTIPIESNKASIGEDQNFKSSKNFSGRSLFVYSSTNSEYGSLLSTALSRRLENIGIPITADKINGGLDIEIARLEIEPSLAENTQYRLTWAATVKLRAIVRQSNNGHVILSKDFVETTAPPVDNSDTARLNSLIQIINSIVDYIDANRQNLNLASR